MITVLFILLFFVSFFSLPGSVEFSSMDQLGDLSVFLKFSARGLAGLFFYFSFLTLLPKMRHSFRGGLLACWVFACWAAGSLLFSAEKFYSFYRLMDLMIMLFAASVVCLRIDSRQAFKKYYYALVGALILLAAVPFLTYHIDPSIGGKAAYIGGELTYRLGGSIMRVGHMGGIMAILVIIAFARLVTRRGANAKYMVPLLGLCLYAMYLTGARSAVVAAIVGVTVILLAAVVHRRWLRVGLAIVLLLCSVIMVISFYKESTLLWFTRGQSISQVAEANDRLAIWRAIWAGTTPRSFLVGHGYQMLSQEGRSIQAVGSIRTPYSSAHNGYVQTFAGTGIVGAIFLLLMFWLVFSRLIRNYRNLRDRVPDLAQLYLELLAIVAAIAVHNLTEFDVGGNTNPIFLTFVLIAGLAVKRPVEILRTKMPPALHYSWRSRVQGVQADLST